MTSSSAHRLAKWLALPLAVGACFTTLSAFQPAAANQSETLIWADMGNQDMDLYARSPMWGGGAIEAVGNDTSPSWAPNGFAVAFTSDRSQPGGNSTHKEIYVQAVGSHALRITNNNTFDDFPDFSPRGDRIAYTTTDHRGRWQIATMGARGDNKRVLTSSIGSSWDPSYSHDGRKIVFLSNRSGRVEIFQMNADGSNEELVYSSPADVQGPSYSPDNGRILFSEKVGGTWDIAWYTLGAGLRQSVTNTPGINEANARYSPNGQKIAFAAWVPGRNPQVAVADYQGNNRQQLSQGRYANWPDWMAGQAQQEEPELPDNQGPKLVLKGKPKHKAVYRGHQVKRIKGHTLDISGVKKVQVAVKLKQRGKCRHVKANGRLTKKQGCGNRAVQVANGAGKFKLKLRQVPVGKYKVKVTAQDQANNTTQQKLRFRVR